jgi:hypothetical protein
MPPSLLMNVENILDFTDVLSKVRSINKRSGVGISKP